VLTDSTLSTAAVMADPSGKAALTAPPAPASNNPRSLAPRQGQAAAAPPLRPAVAQPAPVGRPPAVSVLQPKPSGLSVAHPVRPSTSSDAAQSAGASRSAPKSAQGPYKPGSSSSTAAPGPRSTANSSSSALALDPTNAYAEAGPSTAAPPKQKRKLDVEVGGDKKRGRGASGSVVRRDDAKVDSDVGRAGGSAPLGLGPLRYKRKVPAQGTLSLAPVKGPAAAGGASSSASRVKVGLSRGTSASTVALVRPLSPSVFS